MECRGARAAKLTAVLLEWAVEPAGPHDRELAAHDLERAVARERGNPCVAGAKRHGVACVDLDVIGLGGKSVAPVRGDVPEPVCGTDPMVVAGPCGLDDEERCEAGNAEDSGRNGTYTHGG